MFYFFAFSSFTSNSFLDFSLWLFASCTLSWINCQPITRKKRSSLSFVIICLLWQGWSQFLIPTVSIVLIFHFCWRATKRTAVILFYRVQVPNQVRHWQGGFLLLPTLVNPRSNEAWSSNYDLGSQFLAFLLKSKIAKQLESGGSSDKCTAVLTGNSTGNFFRRRNFVLRRKTTGAVVAYFLLNKCFFWKILKNRKRRLSQGTQ